LDPFRRIEPEEIDTATPQALREALRRAYEGVSFWRAQTDACADAVDILKEIGAVLEPARNCANPAWPNRIRRLLAIRDHGVAATLRTIRDRVLDVGASPSPLDAVRGVVEEIDEALEALATQWRPAPTEPGLYWVIFHISGEIWSRPTTIRVSRNADGTLNVAFDAWGRESRPLSDLNTYPARYAAIVAPPEP
jgi:hypothetical protein